MSKQHQSLALAMLATVGNNHVVNGELIQYSPSIPIHLADPGITNGDTSYTWTPDADGKKIYGDYDPGSYDYLTLRGLGGSKVHSHDPDSIQWLNWENAKWDGTTFNVNVENKKASAFKKEFEKHVCPGPDTIRGLRELFYKVNPFKDNLNPTIAEIDDWHRIAINHIRRLVGWTDPSQQVKPDLCLALRARWGDERKLTNLWDDEEKYGISPCPNSGNSHCGAGFVPDEEDQRKTYLPEGHPPCTDVPGGEGVVNAPKNDIPWSIKFSRAVCNFIGNEGLTGHTGPWFIREKFGWSFWEVYTGNVEMRGKWNGRMSETTDPMHEIDPTWGDDDDEWIMNIIEGSGREITGEADIGAECNPRAYNPSRICKDGLICDGQVCKGAGEADVGDVCENNADDSSKICKNGLICDGQVCKIIGEADVGDACDIFADDSSKICDDGLFCDGRVCKIIGEADIGDECEKNADDSSEVCRDGLLCHKKECKKGKRVIKEPCVFGSLKPNDNCNGLKGLSCIPRNTDDETEEGICCKSGQSKINGSCDPIYGPTCTKPAKLCEKGLFCNVSQKKDGTVKGTCCDKEGTVGEGGACEKNACSDEQCLPHLLCGKGFKCRVPEE